MTTRKTDAVRKRIDVSDSTLALLEALAEYYGHNNTKAALATLAKFGVPMLIGANATPVATVAPTQIEPTAKGVTKVPAKVAETIAASESPGVTSSTATKAEQAAVRLGFQYTKENSSPLVEATLASRQEDYCVGLKPNYSAPTDEAVAALVGLVDGF